MNEFNIIGKALEKPEVLTAENGNNYCHLLISVKKPFQNSDGKYESDTMQVTLFKNCAKEAVEVINDGTPVVIKGHISSNNYSKEGKMYYGFNVIADRISVLNQLY